MRELDHKESWGPKDWCFWAVELEKALESPLHWKEIKHVNSEENQSWTFIGRTDAEAEAPIFWPPNAKSWLTGKDPNAGKDWRQEKNGMTEDEIVGSHHWFNGYEFEQTSEDSEGHQSLVCCSPWGRKKVGHDLATEQQQMAVPSISLLSFGCRGSSLSDRRYHIP